MKSETRDGMRTDWDVPVPMDDALELRADVFRPVAEGRYPVILTCGPYGKGLAFQDGFGFAYNKLVTDFPEVAAGTSQKYQCWETVDPEKWVPDGYVCIRVDSRGAGRSPGRMDLFSPREVKDIYNAIEWAAAQPWCSGKVGMCGISYYAMNQWLVAALQPPHLAAMCPWEGAADSHREWSRHGGILCSFPPYIADLQIKTVQHGVGRRGARSRVTGEFVAGPATLTEEELGGNRAEMGTDHLAHPLDDEFHRSRSPDWSKVTVPFLSAANWGAQGIHLRGNIEAFVRAASKEKWLEVHGLEHWTHFYTDYGVALQKRFFAHYLKGEANGWKEKQVPVTLQIRHPGNRFVERAEREWPLARTQWTRYFLDPSAHGLRTDAPGNGAVTYDALGEGVTFVTPPLAAPTEITGPVAAKLFVSSSTTDADLFLVLRVFTPDMKEISFLGVVDPLTPVGLGWLRASHRKLDPKLSTPYRPYHSHDEKQTLKAGEVVELDIEIWPTCIVIPPGFRIALSVRGRDYQHAAAGKIPLFHQRVGPVVPNGVGPFFHDDPRDRPASIFGGKVTLHCDAKRPSYLLLPVIPAAR
jgi:predicted acyl esterase